VSADHAIGDFRAFCYARPALRTLLAAAVPFAEPIPADVPVTIAWAARDLVLPTWQAEVARAVLPQAEHVTIRGAGHVPMFDDPEQEARILLKGSEPVAAVAPLTAVAGRSRARVAVATA
jgi:pimeloyl-ACP methyl ester carboxylesterase